LTSAAEMIRAIGDGGAAQGSILGEGAFDPLPIALAFPIGRRLRLGAGQRARRKPWRPGVGCRGEGDSRAAGVDIVLGLALARRKGLCCFIGNIRPAPRTDAKD
jgi:hypothetical protein